MVKGRKVARHKPKLRGSVVWDEGANRNLANIVKDWRIIRLKKTDMGISLKDPVVATKYAKGTFPIFTNDHTAYLENPSEKGAIGYIEQSTVPPEEMEEYKIKVKNFFSSTKQKDTKGKIWKIPRYGEPFIKSSDGKKILTKKRLRKK